MGFVATKSNAFARCEKCDGQGFLRVGDFGDRSFLRCAAPPAGCGGAGQRYIDVTPARSSAPATWP